MDQTTSPTTTGGARISVSWEVEQTNAEYLYTHTHIAITWDNWNNHYANAAAPSPYEFMVPGGDGKGGPGDYTPFEVVASRLAATLRQVLADDLAARKAAQEEQP